MNWNLICFFFVVVVAHFPESAPTCAFRDAFLVTVVEQSSYLEVTPEIMFSPMVTFDMNINGSSWPVSSATLLHDWIIVWMTMCSSGQWLRYIRKREFHEAPLYSLTQSSGIGKVLKSGVIYLFYIFYPPCLLLLKRDAVTCLNSWNKDGVKRAGRAAAEAFQKAEALLWIKEEVVVVPLFFFLRHVILILLYCVFVWYWTSV